MKVFIFDSTTIDKAPYIKNYTQIFDEVKIDYDICTWDKCSGNGEVLRGGKLLTIHKQWHFGKRKLLDFIVVSRILKNIINKGKYTHIIIVNSIWAILLADVLKNFKNKYIIDIRDYKCENVLGVKTFLKSIINNSFFTTISSGGFREFLPICDKIIENHNISNWEYEELTTTLYAGKDITNIVYMGHVRYFEENKKLIRKICCDSKYTLSYLGTYAVGCDLQKYECCNISFSGKFDNLDKPRLYQNYDMIHSLYGSREISVTTLLPNRLYDCVQYKKPILVSPNGYLSKVVEKYNLGVVLNLDERDFSEKLYCYIKNFDQNMFLDGAVEFLKIVKRQQEAYFKKIRAFVEH